MTNADFDNVATTVQEQYEEERNAESERSEDGQDYPVIPYVKVAPTVALGYSSIEEIVFFGQATDENGVIEQPLDQQNSDFAVVLNDPEVLKGTLFSNQQKDGSGAVRETDDELQSPIDYMVLDEDGGAFDESFDSDGNLKGVGSEYVSDYPGQKTDDTFAEDQVMFIMGATNAARNVIRTLDANGDRSAYHIDGGRSRGLFEYAPSELDNQDDLDVRPARYPQLREDVDGGFILFGWASDFIEDFSGRPMYYSVVGMDDFDEDASEATFLSPISDHDAISEDSLYELAWHSEENQITTNESDAPSSDDVDLSGTDDTDGDSGVNWSDYNFNDGEREFVGGMIEGVENDDITVDVAHDNWESIVDDNRGEDGMLAETSDPDVLLEAFEEGVDDD